MNDAPPRAHRDPDRLSTLCDAIAETWDALGALPRPIPETDQPRLERLLLDLAQLHDVRWLELWDGDLPAPAQSLNLFDLDDDGHDELLVLCTDGSVLCFRQMEAFQWRLLAGGSTPGGAGPVAGFEVKSMAADEAPIAWVVTAGTQPDEPDRLFEVIHHGDQGLGLHPRPPRRSTIRRRMIGCRYGELKAEGLTSVSLATRLTGDSGLLLRAAPLLGAAQEIPLGFRPSALAHTADRIWSGGSHERVWSWRFTGERLEPAPDWRSDGLPVDGRITALAVWPQPEGSWLLLVATDERCLFAVSAEGQVLGRTPTPHVVTALRPAGGRLWMALENKRLCWLRPLWSPLLARPLPSISEVFKALPPLRRGEIYKSWLGSDDPARVGSAVRGLLEDLATGNEDAEGFLEHLRQPEVAQRPREHLVEVLATLEWAALKEKGTDTPLLRACLRVAKSLYPRFDLRLRWRTDMLTARIAAHVDKAPDLADYRWLSAARRTSDRAHAQRYLEEGPPEAALNLNAEMLIQRRHTAWVFAVSRAIRALVALPDSSHVLLANRAGEVFQIDLAKKTVAARPFRLPDGAIPHTLVVGPLQGSEEPLSVALVTVQGHVYLGPATPDRCLSELKLVHVADHEAWSLAMIPPSPDEPPRLLLGSGAGSLLHYAFEQDRWCRRKETALPAEWLHSLVVDSLAAGEAPLILAAGAEPGGRGIVFLLDLDGSERHSPLRFNSPVLDVRTVKRRGQMSKAIAVACTDGYIYLRQVNGVCIWRYRVGGTARSLDVSDVDGDGNEEIVVGGEARGGESIGNTVHIFDLEGTVRWVIPVKAPVTHVAVADGGAGGAQLLIADLEYTLQVVEVNPPGSEQEQEIRAQAEQCLAKLAESEATSPTDLAIRWLDKAPTPFLRGYAFYHCADHVADGRDTVWKSLLSTDVRKSEVIVQRSYVRALASAARAAGHDPELVRAIVTKLIVLLRDPEVRKTGDAGMALMRQLTLTGRSSSADFKDWAPVLCETASHPQAEVRQATLHALRSIYPLEEGRTRFSPEAWDVLRAALSPGCDDEPWLRDEVAGLLRDTTQSYEDLWELSHRVLAELTDPSLLKALGQREPLRLDSPAMATAIDTLAYLSSAPKLRMLAEPLGRLKEAMRELASGDRTGELLEVYGAIVEAFDLPDPKAWEDFVTDRAPSGGLGRLCEYFEGVQDFAHPALNQLRQTRHDIETFLESPRHADSLRHLINTLNRQADLLVNLPDRDQLVDHLKHFSPLSTALAGLLWNWCRTGGPLNRGLEELTRPAEPVLEVSACSFRRDELLLETHLLNPGRGSSIEELNLRLRKARVHFDNLELTCLTDPGVATDGLTLTHQGKLTLRLHVPLDEPARDRLRNAPERTVAATLYLPVIYFQPPTDWVEKKLEVGFTFRFSTNAKVDWGQDLPRAWQLVERELSRALKTRDAHPILIECAPIARESLVAEAHRLVAPDSRDIVVDLRQWLFYHLRLQASGLQADDATFLAWLAERLWPSAADRVDALRTAGAPRYAFRDLARSQGLPAAILLNNWDRLLNGIGRRHQQWGPLDRVLPFLLDWAEEGGVRLIFVGSFLTEQIAFRRWPAIASRFKVVTCDHIGLNEQAMAQELDTAVGALLKARHLEPTLRRFKDAPGTTALLSACGGYLHVLDHVALPALEKLRSEPLAAPPELDDYLTNYAHRANFFNSLWMWQSFFERLATILVAHGEIPLERRDWAEVGMTLSRDYFTRRPGGQLVKPARLPKGRSLSRNEVDSIKANEFYRSGDVWIRGFAPHRPIPQEWGQPGELFLRLLRAGGGEDLLERLVERRVLLRRNNSHLGKFYVFCVPIQGQWLRSKQIWEYLRNATDGGYETWFPPDLAYDQRPEVQARQPLFPDLRSGLLHRDLPLSEVLPRIDEKLDKHTRPLFLNMYGLSRRAQQAPEVRWSGLVSLANAMSAWGNTSTDDDRSQSTARALFKGLEQLLDLRLLGPSTESPGTVSLDRLPGETPIPLPWAYAEVTGPVEVLRKQVLLVVIQNGREAADGAALLRNWARERFSVLHRGEPLDLDETEFSQAMERSVVIAVVLQGRSLLRESLPAGYGGPHFILLDVPDLTELVIQPEPSQALFTQAFKTVGRYSFTPYKLAGSLPGGSSLFVGRESELHTILGSLDREDHAILGSRRIGKTSLLQEIEYRIRRLEHGRRPFALSLRLTDHSQANDLYAQVKWALRKSGHENLADRLREDPGEDYSDLHEVMYQLYQSYGHPVVVLIDEVDGLYLWDLHKNQERLFQFLRNKLAQASPRICTFVMTGFRHIYLNRLNSGSVFYNFCRFHNLLGVEKEFVGRLVRMLKAFNVKIHDEAEVIGLIERDTYAIPYYVQRSCDHLLRRLDRLGEDSIGPADAQAVLDQDIRTLLKRELWDDLNADPLLILTNHGAESSANDRQTELLKVKSILLATILTLYQHKFQADAAQATPSDGPITFTARESIGYLNELCPDAWPATESAVDRLLRALTMTLALAPATEDREAYLFPNDILPDVLYFHERQGTMNLIVELEEMVEEVRAHGSA